jgi:hypothetical protein
MKKFLLVLMILLIMFCIGFCQYKSSPKLYSNSDQYQQTDSNTKELQAELDKYIQQEQEDKLHKLKLQTLQNPEIINTEFINVGKLIVYQGKVSYSDCLREKRWYGTKEMNIELKYNFGIGIDISLITVKEFIETTVVLEIPKSELVLEYIELNSKESSINGSKTWFSSNYNSNDVNLVLQDAQSKTRSNIESNKDIFNKAMKNLKVDIRELVLKLGYDDVIVEEV